MYVTNQLWSARVRQRGDAPLGRWRGDRLRPSRLRQRIPARRAWHAALRRNPADFFHHCFALDRVYTRSRGFLKPYLRAELAKEEYATTWQEEEQGEPQEERVPRPQVHGRAQRKALDTLTRVTQAGCTKERGSKRGG